MDPDKTCSDTSECEDSERPTIRLCRFISGAEGPCNGMATWALEKSDTPEHVFYTCDAHLAAGIKISGLPAKIELPNAHAGGKRKKTNCTCRSLEWEKI